MPIYGLTQSITYFWLITWSSFNIFEYNHLGPISYYLWSEAQYLSKWRWRFRKIYTTMNRSQPLLKILHKVFGISVKRKLLIGWHVTHCHLTYTTWHVTNFLLYFINFLSSPFMAEINFEKIL